MKEPLCKPPIKTDALSLAKAIPDQNSELKGGTMPFFVAKERQGMPNFSAKEEIPYHLVWLEAAMCITLLLHGRSFHPLTFPS